MCGETLTRLGSVRCPFDIWLGTCATANYVVEYCSRRWKDVLGGRRGVSVNFITDLSKLHFKNQPVLMPRVHLDFGLG